MPCSMKRLHSVSNGYTSETFTGTIISRLSDVTNLKIKKFKSHVDITRQVDIAGMCCLLITKNCSGIGVT